jgi:polar amino acid transport system substrate-binding protein
VQALKNKQIDGIVADLPTAFYMTAAQLDDGVIVGQLPAEGSTPEQFGAVLDKGSPLITCISQAVDALRADGTLDTLLSQWLSTQGAPKLK